MALSIGVHKGSKIKIGNHLLVVKELVPPNSMKVALGESVLSISDQCRTEILPNIFVQTGPSHHPGRLVIDADKSISIERLN